MTGAVDGQGFLDACSVEPAVFDLRPDYRAMLLIVGGLPAGATKAGDSVADEMVAAAEAHARSIVEGVTCRRWNRRQGRRTRLTDTTVTAVFILDAPAPMTDTALGAADALTGAVSRFGGDITVATRTIGALS